MSDTPGDGESDDDAGDEAGFDRRPTAVDGLDSLSAASELSLEPPERELDQVDDFSTTDRVDTSKFESAFESESAIPTLVVLSGARVGETTRLEAGSTLLGRHRERADIWFRDGGVSRVHAAIELGSDAGARVRDLDSSNGTFVNGDAVDSTRELSDGDKIALGKRTILRYSLHDEFDEQFQRRLYESTIRDEVSGAYSRAYLEDKMRSEMSFARRHGHPVSIVLFDIDHFKTINDEHGHVAGDAVLAQLVDLIRSELRREDLLARFGGDEFVVLLRQTDRETARSVAERIRERVGSASFETEDDEIALTVSCGVALFDPPTMEETADWFRAADGALYRAKETGRNDVAVH